MFNPIPFILFGGIGFLLGGATGCVVGLIVISVINMMFY